MLLQVVKDGFNFGTSLEEFSLPFGHELFGLLVMGWGQDERSKYLTNLAVHGLTAVASVANRYFGVFIDGLHSVLNQDTPP